MRKIVLCAALVAGAGCAATGSSSPADVARPAEEAIRAEVETAIARVYPALVRIHVVWLDYRGGREQKYEASGSGALISADGLVVTNHHVAGHATLITCTLANKEEIRADLVGTDALADIAVLKLRLGERKDPNASVPVASFGDSDTLRVGDPVLAMGSPHSLSQSVTRGVVSNRDMIMPRFFGSFELDGENVGSLVKWIGHDAAIFPGNSGGPLVNLRGEIVGINEIGVGLGGAIPSNLVREIVDQLVVQKEVKRSWVGMIVQPLLRGSEMERGALVASVVEGSPADRAGLRSGDVLLTYGGEKLRGLSDLLAAFKKSAGLERVPLTLWRRGKTVELNVKPGRLGVSSDKRSAREAVLAQRELERLLRGIREGTKAFPALPGTRWEVESLARMFSARGLAVEKLLGSAASEQRLRELLASGALAEYRYLHFATHGVPNLERAFDSALLLSRDRLPDPLDAVLSGGELVDGNITAAEILRTWTLNADLVVLSACQTAVGRYAGGEGYLGFAQALLLSGARSVVLSLWKVDDIATMLLMTRFYENLLGARAGLGAGMPKAEALREAQRWLRALTRDEVEKTPAKLPRGERGKVRERTRAGASRTTHPYEHPYYWAAFILIGDPD